MPANDFTVARAHLRCSALLLLVAFAFTVGLYEVLLCDTEVVTVWATDLDSHLALQRSYDAALGLDDEIDADERLLAWRERAREFLDGTWRETLLSPYPGSRLAP